VALHLQPGDRRRCRIFRADGLRLLGHAMKGQAGDPRRATRTTTLDESGRLKPATRANWLHGILGPRAFDAAIVEEVQRRHQLALATPRRLKKLDESRQNAALRDRRQVPQRPTVEGRSRQKWAEGLVSSCGFLFFI